MNTLENHSFYEESSMQECIDNCLNCFKVCEDVLSNFELISKLNSQQFKTLKSCVEICQTSAKMMIIGSPFHRLTCEACSKICVACAEMCEKLGGPNLSECGRVCRQCAESCGAMAVH